MRQSSVGAFQFSRARVSDATARRTEGMPMNSRPYVIEPILELLGDRP
jgi:hypothetical protein